MEKLNTMMAEALCNLQQSIDYAEENDLTNTQEFLKDNTTIRY